MAAAPADRRPSPTASPVAPPESTLSRHSWAHFHYPWPAPGRPRSQRRALKPNCFCRLHHFPHFSVKEREREGQSINYHTTITINVDGALGFNVLRHCQSRNPKLMSLTRFVYSPAAATITQHTRSVVENK